jgi:hypothetical protein
VASTLELLNAANIAFIMNAPVLLAEQTVAQNIVTATPTPATFTTLARDNYSGYSTATSTYTVPVAGTYVLNVLMHWAANATGARQALLKQNGTATVLISNATPNSGAVTTVLSGSVQCAVGDTLTIQLDQTSGGNLSTQVGSGFNSSWSLQWDHA